MDIIGPLPITERNNQYIIVIVDYFTKWVEAEPLATVNSKDVTYFLSRVFARHGTPQVITTDNGTQFNSDMTRIFLDLYDVYIHFSATYHPENNGMTENRNRKIGKYFNRKIFLPTEGRHPRSLAPVTDIGANTYRPLATAHTLALSPLYASISFG